jgi:DNA-binding XRE family transcriptional regulator
MENDPTSAATRLRELRKKAGMSIRDLAKAIGRRHTTYVFYETAYKKKYLPMDLVTDLIPVFEEHGISMEEVCKLAGLRPTSANSDAIYVKEPDVNPEDFDAAALGSGPLHTKLMHPGDVDEGYPYRGLTVSHPDYHHLDDILAAIYPGNHPYACLWQMTRSCLEFYGYLPGDILAVDISITPQAGDVVCAEFPDNSISITGFRIYSPPFLLSASSQQRQPLLVDGTSVSIKGVVMGSCRRRMSGGG